MSARSTILAIPLFLLLSGCVSKELTALSTDIANVQTETSDALISAIKADMERLTDPLQKAKAQILINRLDYLKRGNTAMNKELLKPLSSKEIAELLKEYSNIKGGS